MDRGELSLSPPQISHLEQLREIRHTLNVVWPLDITGWLAVSWSCSHQKTKFPKLIQCQICEQKLMLVHIVKYPMYIICSQPFKVFIPQDCEGVHQVLQSHTV